jgi:hypothetical protein
MVLKGVGAPKLTPEKYEMLKATDVIDLFGKIYLFNIAEDEKKNPNASES